MRLAREASRVPLGNGEHGVDALSIAMAFPDDFTTPRVTAERLRLRHAESLHDMHANERHMAFIGGVRSETQTAEILRRGLAHWDEHGFGVWIVRTRDTERVAGRVLLRVMPVDGIDEIELGYSYDPEYWGRGLATEVAQVCMAEARGHFGFSRFVAVTNPANDASQHVLRKLGFVECGVIDQEDRPLTLFRHPDALGARPGDSATMRTSST